MTDNVKADIIYKYHLNMPIKEIAKFHNLKDHHVSNFISKFIDDELQKHREGGKKFPDWFGNIEDDFINKLIKRNDDVLTIGDVEVIKSKKSNKLLLIVTSTGEAVKL